MSFLSAGIVGGPDIPDSAISRWTFDDADTESGTALDSWGSYDGTINGATTGVNGANQTYNTAEGYSFDGTDDGVDFGDIAELNGASEMTVAVWVYNQTAASSNGIMVSKSDSGGGNQSENTFAIYKDDNTDDYLSFAMGDGSTTYSVNSDGVLPQDAWTHCVGVYDASDLILYVNGAEEDRNTIGSITLPDGTEPVRAGRRGNGLYFEGRLDDARLYSKGLTTTEVSNLYNTGSISG